MQFQVQLSQEELQRIIAEAKEELGCHNVIIFLSLLSYPLFLIPTVVSVFNTPALLVIVSFKSER